MLLCRVASMASVSLFLRLPLCRGRLFSCQAEVMLLEAAIKLKAHLVLTEMGEIWLNEHSSNR